MNENDLRVQRSRRLLQNALVELVASQGYEHVTIRDITKKAQVGYKTFFRHYESKETLLQAILNKIKESFQQNALLPSEPNAMERNTLACLKIAKENKGLLLAVLKSPMANQLLQPVIDMAQQDRTSFFGRLIVPNDIVDHHFATSMMSLIQWWLENDQAYSIDQMAEYINLLVIRPMGELKELAE
ncbi:MAG: TetR/AcrR family transcriptional regulator [Anaerolineae bacterium]